VGWAISDRVCHHVSHFKLKKTAKESTHMNTQAGTGSRQAIAASGKTEIGIQPTAL
jgi:hypothetical protein